MLGETSGGVCFLIDTVREWRGGGRYEYYEIRFEYVSH